MESKTTNKHWLSIDKLSFGGVTGACILGFVIVLGEVLPAKCGGDFGPFLWTTFHFVINPLLCLLFIAITIVKIVRTKSIVIKVSNLLLIVLAFAYIYIVYSGNTEWVKVLGISFKG